MTAYEYTPAVDFDGDRLGVLDGEAWFLRSATDTPDGWEPLYRRVPAAEPKVQPCADCNGEGYTEVPRDVGAGSVHHCGTCNGTGIKPEPPVCYAKTAITWSVDVPCDGDPYVARHVTSGPVPGADIHGCYRHTVMYASRMNTVLGGVRVTAQAVTA